MPFIFFPGVFELHGDVTTPRMMFDLQLFQAALAGSAQFFRGFQATAVLLLYPLACHAPHIGH